MSDVTGGSSTLGSLVQSTRTAFNLREENDVVALLRQIHHSPIQPDDKNELRDAIFVFRNAPNSELTPELIAKFAEYSLDLTDDVTSAGAVEVEVKESLVPTVAKKSAGRLGTTRPNPHFAKLVVPASLQNAPAEPEVPTITTPEPAQPAPAVVPEMTTPDVPAAPVAEVVSAPEPNPSVVPEMSKVTVPTQPPTSTPQEVVAPSSTPVADAAGSLGRIKEIKKEVNLLVGNPVNLIDVHNEVGREYMNALLDAMKKNNGGTPEEVDRAMERLELAFTSVKETVGVTGDGAQVPAPKQPEESVVAPVTPTSNVTEVPVVPKPVVEQSEPVSEPVQSGFASVHQTHVQGTDVSTDSVSIPQVEREEAAPVVEPVSVSLPHDKVMSQEEPVISVQKPAAPIAEVTEEKLSAPAVGGIMSVAKEKQIQDLMTAEKQQAATTDQQRKAIEVASMDPLMTPEVTSGLQQLLSEWSLFKSSGIFGTGPSGMEHQLYKKLATLTMTAVVAGRFEGATPEIKRSITDYMNGWRYEEGILQVQGEQFEHYLRRVIKHILDKRG